MAIELISPSGTTIEVDQDNQVRLFKPNGCPLFPNILPQNRGFTVPGVDTATLFNPGDIIQLADGWLARAT